jgi:hypothetical protein
VITTSPIPRRRPRILFILTLIALPAALGCSVFQGVSALREVTFDIESVSDVRIAGIRVDDKRSFSDLNGFDIARLGAAVLAKDVPLDATVHVIGENPQSNEVDARLTEMDWELFVEDRKTLEGRLDQDFVFPAGYPIIVPLRVRTDISEIFESGSAQDLFNLALALADQGGDPVEVRLDARPSIETRRGKLKYPYPVSLRKTVGGREGLRGVSN